MKYEWKKQDKGLYLPKNKPETVMVPPMRFFMLDGRGNPNNEDFAEIGYPRFTGKYIFLMRGRLPQKSFRPFCGSKWRKSDAERTK